LARAIAYQWQITGLPPGLAIWVNGQNYDGCRETDGTLLEAKGPGYQKIMEDPHKGFIWNGIVNDFLDQGENQDRAAGGRALEWHFAEKPVADKVREIFKAKGINARVIFTPAIVDLSPAAEWQAK
jgi:hypothetical protein